MAPGWVRQARTSAAARLNPDSALRVSGAQVSDATRAGKCGATCASRRARVPSPQGASRSPGRGHARCRMHMSRSASTFTPGASAASPSSSAGWHSTQQSTSVPSRRASSSPAPSPVDSSDGPWNTLSCFLLALGGARRFLGGAVCTALSRAIPPPPAPQPAHSASATSAAASSAFRRGIGPQGGARRPPIRAPVSHAASLPPPPPPGAAAGRGWSAAAR